MENSNRKQSFVGENKKSRLYSLTDIEFPHYEIVFGGEDSFRQSLDIEATDFVGVKGFKARGKRLTVFKIKEIRELEPTRQSNPVEDASTPPEAEEDADDVQIAEPGLFDEM